MKPFIVICEHGTPLHERLGGKIKEAYPDRREILDNAWIVFCPEREKLLNDIRPCLIDNDNFFISELVKPQSSFYYDFTKSDTPENPT